MERSAIDLKDQKRLSDFYGPESKICCSMKCNRTIPEDVALQHRYSFLELTKDEQDLVILSHLQSHRKCRALKHIYDLSHVRKRLRLVGSRSMVRNKIKYFFLSIPVCANMYFFVHDMSKKRYKNLASHFDKEGLTTRVHGNKNKTPNRTNIFTVQEIEKAAEFIASSNKRGKSADKSNGDKKGRAAKVTAETKISLYRRYRDHCDESGMIVVI